MREPLDEELIEKAVDEVADDISDGKWPDRAMNLGITTSDFMLRVATELKARGE